MPWDRASRRRAELPPDWPIIRRDILERDHYHCRIQDPQRCIGTASEVDHIGNRHDHSRHNLRAACRPCHATRTAAQGHAAQPRRRRTNEPHPGLI